MKVVSLLTLLASLAGVMCLSYCAGAQHSGNEYTVEACQKVADSLMLMYKHKYEVAVDSLERMYSTASDFPADYQGEQAERSKEPQQTQQAEGEIFTGPKGGQYIWKTSAKTGLKYKKYLPK